MPTTITVRQYGFTLLEALVTIVIVSIGLLGILGLQTAGIANTQVSAARGQASIAADNMADRIRANPVGAHDGAYDGIAPDSSAANNSQPSGPKCKDNSYCQPAEMAQFDGEQWNQTLAGQLPNGRGFVKCAIPADTGPGCQSYVITVVWREGDRTNKAAKGQCPQGINALDNCFQTSVRP